MTGLEREFPAIARRAEAAAGFGTDGDDGELESDLEDFLQREEGAGWDLATSRSLDPNGRCSIRKMAWWLTGRGLDVCTLRAESVDAIATAIDDRVDSNVSVPDIETRASRGIDIVAYDSSDGTAYLIQVTAENLDSVDDISDEPLRSLVRTELWLSSDELEIVPAVLVRDSAFGVVERESAADDETNGDQYGVRRTDPPGEHGLAAVEMTLAGSKSDVLCTIPPCDGAIAGAAAMELLLERTVSRDGSDPTTQQSILRRVEDELDVGALRKRFTTTIGESSLFSRVKIGSNRYLYLNPRGVVTAAVLLSRLGVSVTTTEAMDAMRDSKKSFGRTLSRVEQQVQEAKRRAPGRPYGVLPDLFDERNEG